MTLREEKLLYALKESHKLLKHYAELLNMYDGGKRIIPKSIHRWIRRLEEVKENNARKI